MARYLMGNVERNRIFDEAIQTWGVIPQVNVAVEEFSELTKALCKYFYRGKSLDDSELIGELADARIMIDQVERILELYVDPDIQSKIEAVIDEKLQRVEERINKATDVHSI